MRKLILSLSCLFVLSTISAQETLNIAWPDEYNWTLLSNHEDEKLQILEIIPANQTKDNWSLLGQMTAVKGSTKITMDKAKDLMFSQTKQNAPNATITEIERNETAEHPWIIFKVECPSFTNDSNPESQLWYIIRSDNALYMNFIASKTDKLSPAFADMWSHIFKNSQISNQ